MTRSTPDTRLLGIDVGGTSLKWVVLEDTEVVDHGRVDTPRTSRDDVFDLVAQVGAACGPVAAVGIGVPGLYEPDGTTTLLPNLPGDWAGFPLARNLADQLGVPVHVANDVRAFTLAELRVGAGRGCRDLVAVAVGTGVGGGVVSGGRLHLGDRQRAGEIGHQAVVTDGRRCGCGARGCVETVASGPAILAEATRGVLQGITTRLRDECGGDPAQVTVEAVAACAEAGDPFATDVLVDAASALGRGLANACTILAPQRVVIGGGVAAALQLVLPTISEAIREYARLPDPPEIATAELGRQAGAIGAALWALESEEESKESRI